MGQVRKFAILLVVNIFLTLLVTVLLEYINLAERFQALDNTVQICLDQALNSSISAEEFFSSDYQANVISDSDASASLLLFGSYGSSGKFFSVNPYHLAMYMNENGGKLPNYQGLNDLAIRSKNINSDDVYRFLYGEVGSAYNDSDLAWANTNPDTQKYAREIGDSKRTPNPELKEFYDKIGVQLKARMTVKVRTDDGKGYTLATRTIPTLAQMGLDLAVCNQVKNGFTMDNFTSSAHIGKTIVGNNSIHYSKYYLTPYSLGVTYIPTKVLKPVFLANLDTYVRLQKSSSGNNTKEQFLKNANKATGCISTEVYHDGVIAEHKVGDLENIINDGEIEYDLNSVALRVEYFLVDYNNYKSDSSIREIIARIEGCNSIYKYSSSSKPMRDYTYTSINGSSDNTSLFFQNAQGFIENDTARKYYKDTLGITKFDEYVQTKRIVAKVTVRLKVHMCYDSSILQWICDKYTGGDDIEHYDIKMFNRDGNYVKDDDGIWYQYTTYYGHTR